MQLCGMMEDDDGESCRRCWENYLFWVSNDRVSDPYAFDRRYEGGMLG